MYGTEHSRLLLGDAPHKLSSPFGNRKQPVTGQEGTFHNGNDYATYGACPPIYCPFDNGIIVRKGLDRYKAKFVYIAFPDLGYVGLAYHCSKFVARINQKLNKGDIIGYVGSTGRSTGEHLHWSWIKLNSRAYKYYEADYVDFEKYKLNGGEDMSEKVYNTVAEIPSGFRGTVEELISMGAITGGTDGKLALTESALKAIIIMKRYVDRKK